MKKAPFPRFVFMTLFITLFVSKLQAQYISTCAGTDTNYYNGANMYALSTNLSFPWCVALDDSGNLFIADLYFNIVRKVNRAGLVTNFAGTDTPYFRGDGGPATAALLFNPGYLYIDHHENVFISDASNNSIRMVNPAGIIITIAGHNTVGYAGDGGPATDASLSAPCGITEDNSGNIYIADTRNYVIRKVNPAGIISTIAGTGTMGYSGDGGPATAALLGWPMGLCIDASENIYVADQRNSVIRKITPAGIITTVAGNGVFGYSGDGGPATLAQLNEPATPWVDKHGNLFIADPGNNVIREVLASNGYIQTIAGNHIRGFSGDGGSPIDAELNDCTGVTVDSSGVIYIGDGGNGRVRKISSQKPRISVPEMSKSGSLSIVPNPNTGTFTVSWSSPLDKGSTISLYNASGKLIMEQAAPVAGESKLDCFLPTQSTPGIYFLNVMMNGERLTEKIRVE